MIRRGFWLTVGAVGGIMAYRRIAYRPWARETIRFARDVRAGMDEYVSRHPGRVGPTLEASAVAARGEDSPHVDEKDDR